MKIYFFKMLITRRLSPCRRESSTPTCISDTHICCQNRQTFYCFQTGINILIKSSMCLLLSSCLFVFLYYVKYLFTCTKSHSAYTTENHNASQFPRNENLLFIMFGKPTDYKSTKITGESSKIYEQKPYSNIQDENDILWNGKRWMRISDEVFVYSAHLDTRNFTTSYPMLNNSLQGIDSRSGVNGKQNGQMAVGDVDDVGDSDKLTHVILVRIVGMKAVPSLREFIKGDILDWFRIKHEMEYSQKYLCKLFFTPSSATRPVSIVSSRVTYTVIEEGVKIFASSYFNCYFAMNSSIYETIKSVALANDLQISMYPKGVLDYPTKLINVGTLMIKMTGNRRDNSHFRQKSLSVCVRPLFGPFDDLEKLVQFISYYHAMGISQFNFYSMSISSRIRKYLMKIMMMRREATIGKRKQLPRFYFHDWNLPTGNTSELWDYGTLAALNDCLFANIDQDFLIFVDVDEFIVPRLPNSFTGGENKFDHQHTLWAIIDSYDMKETYQYLIRNTFFCHEFCEKGGNKTNNNMNFSSLSSSSSSTPDTTPMLTASFPANNNLSEFPRRLPIFRCFDRTKRVWNPAMRSKFIVNPREVLAVGHHLVTKYVRKIDFRFSRHSVQVDPNVGILHHYRECTSISSRKHPILTRLREIDKTMLKFQIGVYDSLLRYYLP